jgi:hypothetical protein
MRDMETGKGGVVTMGRSRFGATTALMVAALALAFAVLSIREAASQQTPQAQPTWTPRPECQRLEALRAAANKANRPWTPEELQEVRDIVAKVGFDGCEREAEWHQLSQPQPQAYRPEWGPRFTPGYVIRRVLPLPTPDTSP